MANLKVTPPPGDNMPQAGDMSPHAVKIVGFLVAGGVLIALAEFAPDAAIGLALVVGLGVLLTHADELQAWANALAAATGH